jgi:asparagine synthase (glutamine-hydrolysing)
MDIVISQTRVDAHFIYPSLKEAVELIPDIIWHQDEPYQSQSVFLAYNVFRLASTNGVKVLLNGQGADEYLGGYGQFTTARFATRAKQLKLFSIITEIKNLEKEGQSSYLALLKSTVYHILPSFIRRGITNIAISSNYVKKIIDCEKLNTKPTHPYSIIPVNYRTVPEISEHFTFYSTLPKYLRWEDRNSMAHSVEARVPFLDHRLVEFNYNLPDDFLERDGITKRVMREAMNELLPQEIKNRKDKMGFTTPEEIWVKQENPAFFRHKISEAIFVTDGIIKPEALVYFDKMIYGKIPFDYTYWRLILFSEWIQKFQIKIS